MLIPEFVPWRQVSTAVVWLACLVASGCAVSLKSAATVGEQGSKLSEGLAAADTDTLCDLGAALTVPPKGADCAKWSEKAKSRRAALEVLAKYGAALKKLAELKDPDTADGVAGMFDALAAGKVISETDLTEEQKNALKSGIGGLAAFVSKAHRVEVITTAVKQVNESLQALVRNLVAIFKDRGAYLEGLDSALAGSLKASPSSGADARTIQCEGAPGECPARSQVLVNATDRVSLALARAVVRDAARENEKVVADLSAFAKAHGKLREQIDRLDKDDAKLAEELFAEIRKVYGGVQSESGNGK